MSTFVSNSSPSFPENLPLRGRLFAQIVQQRLIHLGVPAQEVRMTDWGCDVGPLAYFTLNRGRLELWHQERGPGALQGDIEPYGTVDSLADVALMLLGLDQKGGSNERNSAV